MLSKLSKLESILGYNFRQQNDVQVAIVHPGFHKNAHNRATAFERLEFLGDRVLGLSLAAHLYQKFPNDKEGDLAMRIASLAGTDFLISLAKRKGLLDCFSVPKDFFMSQHKTSAAIADIMEAVLGSIFLDSDFMTVQKVVLSLWSDDLDKVVYKQKDPKTLLQEITQAMNRELPVYRLIKMSGELHNPLFEVEVSTCKLTERGYGNTKKQAEHDAATRILSKLKEQQS